MSEIRVALGRGDALWVAGSVVDEARRGHAQGIDAHAICSPITA